jgi:anaerobic magnesium-protoporphyrin IX monomethyl ester cyclase
MRVRRERLETTHLEGRRCLPGGQLGCDRCGGLTTTYNCIKEISRIAKSVSPTSLLVAGGGFLTSMPRDIMEWIPEVDVGVVGEAFLTFPEILQMVDEGDRDFSKTLGVITRRDGLTAARPVIHDLDSLPWPAWEMFPLEEVYFKNSIAIFGGGALLLGELISMVPLDAHLFVDTAGTLVLQATCWLKARPGGKNDVVFHLRAESSLSLPAYIVAMVASSSAPTASTSPTS